MKKLTLQELKSQLVFAEDRAVNSSDLGERMRAKEEVRLLKNRIRRRERDEAMRSVGLVKVRGALGGTYYE